MLFTIDELNNADILYYDIYVPEEYLNSKFHYIRNDDRYIVKTFAGFICLFLN